MTISYLNGGTWKLHYEKDKLCGVSSCDDVARVIFEVNEDFTTPEERIKYCEDLVETMNDRR